VLTDFYTAFSPACFSLLALWLAIIAINAHAWLTSRQRQRQAYVVALYFAAPGTMSLLALINPLSTFAWRVFFIIVSGLGVAGMLLFGPFSNRKSYRLLDVSDQAVHWIATGLYLAIAALAFTPKHTLRIEGVLLTVLLLLGVHVALRLMFAVGVSAHEASTTAPAASATADDIELHIYLADGSQHAAVQSALESVLTDHGVADFQWEDPLTGSWFWHGKAKAAAEEVGRIGIELRRAAELRALDIPQSSVDANQGRAVSEFLTALSGERDAVIRIGSILLVKSDGIPVVLNLTQFELAALQRNPTWLAEPSRILHALQDAH
jgi:hypothetical protein